MDPTPSFMARSKSLSRLEPAGARTAGRDPHVTFGVTAVHALAVYSCMDRIDRLLC